MCDEDKNIDLLVPYVPNTIMTIFKKDYPYIQELLEYKRDGTLAFLKASGAIAFYQGKLGLEVKKDVKCWGDFIEFSRDYTKKFVQEGLQKYQNKEKGKEKKKFQILDMGFLEPAILTISNGITNDYLKRFPKWPDSGTQEDFLNIFMNSSLNTNDIRFYWLCRGTIIVKDTAYNYPINGCLYRAEFSGKPEFQLAYFDLEKIRQCNEMCKNQNSQIKKIIDKLEEKILEQNLTNLLINMEM